MGRSGFKIEGIEQSVKKINEIINKTENVSRKTMQSIAADLKGKSIEKCPVDLGDLRGSAYYRTEVTRDGITAEVGFSSPYALKQHESLEFNHPQGGEAKFLQKALEENIDKYIDKIKHGVENGVT